MGRYRLSRIYLIVVSQVFIVFLLLLIVEGGLSWYHLLKDLHYTSQIKEEKYTEYDQLLGWRSIPGIVIPNMYGQNKNLSINKMGFRITPNNLKASAPKAICSGESFTLGYGVDDKDSWCYLLGLDSLQTINMGQGGYGLDQMYLWYLRDAANIPHEYHIIALTDYSFDRVADSTFIGYNKPFFRIVEKDLVNVNFPVPKNNRWKRYYLVNQEIIDRWNIFRSAKRLKFLIEQTYFVITGKSFPESGASDVQFSILQAITRITRTRGAVPVFVIMPTLMTPDNMKEHVYKYTKYKQMLTRLAKETNIHVIDLEKVFDQLEGATYVSLFLPDRHLTERGNQLIAKLLSAELEKIHE